MVRVHLGGPAFDDSSPAADPECLAATDTYVKLLLAKPGLGLGTAVRPRGLARAAPEAGPPARRTYTVRAVDHGTRTIAIDFVVHGDDGLAGPWAASAQPGDRLGHVLPRRRLRPERRPRRHARAARRRQRTARRRRRPGGHARRRHGRRPGRGGRARRRAGAPTPGRRRPAVAAPGRHRRRAGHAPGGSGPGADPSLQSGAGVRARRAGRR